MTSFIFLLFISILNSPAVKCKQLLCPPISQWRRGKSFTSWYSQNGLHVDLKPWVRMEEDFFVPPELYWLPEDESNVPGCWARGWGSSAGGSHHLVLPRVSLYLVLSLQRSLWSFLPAGKSPCVSTCREKRTICVFQKFLKLMPK